MDPLGTIQAIISVVGYLKAVADKVKENQQECKRLCAHTETLLDAIQQGPQGEVSPALSAKLSKLENTLRGLCVTVEELSRLSFLQRTLWRDDVSARIAVAYRDISDAVQLLHLGIHIDLHRFEWENEVARQHDAQEAERNFERILRNEQDILQELQVHRQQMQEAMMSLHRYLLRLPQSPERTVLEDGMHALQRRSGPMESLPDEFVITSLEIIIRYDKKYGEGGFASVYEADWKGSKVAVKVLEKGVPPSAIQQEIDVWKQLRHPRILQFFGACAIADSPFIVCELRKNGDIIQYLRKNPLANRLQLIHDAVLGLVYLHSNHIVHGDLKGANILVDEHGRACLSDFGLSKIKIHSTTVRKTGQDASQYGTARWMSPESMVLGITNKKTDVYSFGMTMYEIFSGIPPFANSPDVMLLQIVYKERVRPPRPDSPNALSLGLDDKIWKLITRCWAHEPTDRPSASDIPSQLMSQVTASSDDDLTFDNLALTSVLDTMQESEAEVDTTIRMLEDLEVSSEAGAANTESDIGSAIPPFSANDDIQPLANTRFNASTAIAGSGAKFTGPDVQLQIHKTDGASILNGDRTSKDGETIDMDFLNENRSLIHSGKLLRPPNDDLERSDWTELFVLLFDDYLVMTKPVEKEGLSKCQVYRRPIPLDLLTLINFTDPPTQRYIGVPHPRPENQMHDPTFSNPSAALPSPATVTDSRAVYPCTVYYNGRSGGLWTLFAESAQARNEWKAKLEEAVGLRKVVQESNRVFEIETLSADTFLAPSIMPSGSQQWNYENAFTGKVTCSVPFTTADGQGLVAIGCAGGVWIGFRHDSRSMRHVLHLKMVTQCAVLEDFGIFLVLADKSLFAYHIEALMPSSSYIADTSQTSQKLSGSNGVHFFSVGQLKGRTLVIYMKKKGLDSVFRVLEPVAGRINERAKVPQTLGSRLGLRAKRSEWFRVYRDFSLPSESFDLIFLNANLIVILCTKGFEIMDLTDDINSHILDYFLSSFKSVTIPRCENPRLEKRCESCRPMGIFRSSKDEFLLCYDEFGLYVDRHGYPSKSVQTIKWEGTAEHVAWHPPYVLLFHSRFIEIRHVETGRLAQIIPGNDVRCIWDGRGTTTNLPATPGPDGWNEGMSQEPRVHVVMNATDSGPQPGNPRSVRLIAQHVFELIPTIPLYVPGSSSSPSRST